MKICPKCNFPSDSKTECTKCGVQFGDLRKKSHDREPDPFIPCAFDNCPERAMVRTKTPTGIANLCFVHSDQLHLDGVNQRLAARDLQPHDGESRRDWHERLMADIRSKRFGRKIDPHTADQLAPWSAMLGRQPAIPRQREPGDDDEPIPP